MSSFHDGMNHWQRQWLSDRLHRKAQNATPAAAHVLLPFSAKPELQRKPKRHPDIAKVLRLNPNSEKALKLLEEACYRSSSELVRVLLDAIPPNQLNNTSRNSCSALEKFVARRFFNSQGIIAQDEEHLKSIEQLLDAGARWNPPIREIRGIRRNIMRYDARYVVQLLRLLFYTPNAANPEQFLEFCRSKALEDKIAAVDQPLVNEIKTFRKSKPLTEASNAEAEMGIQPVSVELSPSPASIPAQATSEF